MTHRILAFALAAVLAVPCAGCGTTPQEPSSDETASAPQPVETIYPNWTSHAIYTAGDIVIYQGCYFKALWWTRGNEPTKDVERDEWQYLGKVPVKHSRYFNDVSDDAWYAGAVNALARRGILEDIGSSSGFLPSRPVTRAQFAAMLCRVLGIAPTEGGDNFADAGDEWYTPYLASLKQLGLASGGTNGNFYPDHYITRQEMCLLIYNVCDGFAEDPATVFAPYRDGDQVSVWAIQAMSWCIERGIVQGSGDLLLPDATASRAEAAQIIYNLLARSS